MPEQHTPTAAPAAPLPPAPRHRGGVGEAAGWLGYGCISRQNFERRGRPSPRWFCRCGGAGWRAPPDTGARRLGHHAVHRTQGTRGTASTPVATDNVRAGPLYCLTRQCGLFCRTTCSHLQHRWCNSRGRGPMACLTHLSTMWSSAVGTPTALPPALPAPQYTATPHTTHPAHPAGRCAQAAETARSDWPVRPHPVVPVAYVTHTPLHTDSQKTQTLHTEWNPEGCFAQSWCLRWHSQQLLAAVLEAMHAKCTEDTVLSVVMWLQNLTSTAVRLRYSQTLLHSVLYDFFTLWSTSVFTHDSTPPLWNLLRSTIVNTLHTLRTPTLIALHRQLPNDTARAALQKLTAMPAVR
uniref:Uncharacterized protein n=1 Tax=Lygus hesperus TaxID=30085 RepID=A0A146KMM6_LYGHE